METQAGRLQRIALEPFDQNRLLGRVERIGFGHGRIFTGGHIDDTCSPLQGVGFAIEIDTFGGLAVRRTTHAVL